MEELTIELLELGTQMEIQALVEFQAPLCTGQKLKLYRFDSFLDAKAYEEQYWNQGKHIKDLLGWYLLETKYSNMH